MVDISNSGFMAIQPPAAPTGAPKAKRKVVTGPDGTPHVVYVDLSTGQELQNLSGYHVIESGSYMDLDELGLSPTQSDPNKETTAQKTIASIDPNKQLGSRGEKESKSGGFVGGRNQGNNFGYINQPGALGIASMVPGPIGNVAKAAKVGIGMNNNAAINTARQTMGLPDQGIGSSIKGTVKDQKGHVADVNLNGVTHSVGLEALDKRGMTTMTPDEANKRAAANKVSISLATDDEISAMESRFDSEFGKNKGLLGSFATTASSFIDSIFGKDDDISESIRSQNSGSNFTPSRSGFADMLGSSGVGKAATSTKTSPVSGAARSTAGKVSTGGGGSDRDSSAGGARAGSGGSEGASARSGGVF
jgi:hypothetical protein